MTLAISDSTSAKVKSFWSRPEGKTGMLALGGIGVLGWMSMPAILTGLTTLSAIIGTMVGIAAQSVLLVLIGTVLFSLLYVITNSKFQTLAQYFFKSTMRWVTNWFVEIDPIGIMKTYVSRMVEKREVIAVARDKLRGQIKIVEQELSDANSEYKNAMAMAKVARDKGNQGVLQVQSRQAMRMEKLAKTDLVPMKAQLEAHLRAINKYYEVTGVVIEDLENEVKAQSRRRKAILASHTAMKAAKAIMQGDQDERELFDQSLEFLVEDYGMKLGEIESFIENSKPFVDGLDMQNGVYEAEALKKLQEWETGAESVLLGTEKAKILEQTTANSIVFTGVGVPAAAQVDYAELLKK